MYNLSEAYRVIGSHYMSEVWHGRYAVAESNSERTFLTNELSDTLSCYTFTLVLQGSLLLESSGHTLSFKANDLYIYLPGFPVRIQSASADYRSIVLLVDEQATYETSAFRDLTRASFYPLIQYGIPKLSLQPADARRLELDIRALDNRIQYPTVFNDEVLEKLYSVFLLDLTSLQNSQLNPNKASSRTIEIFISFYALVRQYYVVHHDIGFYANQLHITTTYLSRIVKQTTGRTVVEYINQMLATEAMWLLHSSSLSIGQIAEHLHFASTASFDRFFLRMRGKLPKTVRTK